MPDEASPGATNLPPLAPTRGQLAQLARLLSWPDSPQLKQWQQTLCLAEERLQQAQVRIAVLGAVKSGKSTLLNALLGADRLRRGAGILTSIVTRVQTGDTPQASLTFKSISALEQEFEAAWSFLQATEQSSPPSCQLAQEKERRELQRWLDERTESETTLAHFGAERAFLRACLEGYDSATPFLRAESNLQIWSGSESEEHRRWVEQDARAVFLEDVLLQEPGWSWPGTEIADCQGSDSPNPLHFVRVQEYAARCSLLIYVISSRTGVRQADVRLLRNLRQLGLAEQLMFVINLDLNEHEDGVDADRVVRQILRDLQHCGWTNPPLYAFSALHRLLQRKNPRKLQEERQLEFWHQHPLLSQSEDAWLQFQLQLATRLEQQQRQTLLAGEWAHWRRLHQQVYSFVERLRESLADEHQDWTTWQGDLQQRQRFLRYHEHNLRQLLQGGETEWKRFIDHGVRALFDTHEGVVWNSLQRFIRQLELSPTQEEVSPQTQSLLWLQETREALLRWVAEEINVRLLPELAKLRRELAQQVHRTVAPSFEVLDELQARQRQLQQQLQGDPSIAEDASRVTWQFPERETISFTSTLAFQTPEQIRSWFTFGQSWLRALWKNERNPAEEFRLQSQRELQRQLQESLEFDVINYRENLKYRTLWAGTRELLETILVRWQESAGGCQEDLSGLLEQLGEIRSQRKKLLPALEQWLREWEQLGAEGVDEQRAP